MRLILGIVVGILITVGGAYITDSFAPAPAAGETAETHMVNWEVVGRRFSELGTNIREAWNRLTGATAPTKSGT
ncbi:MAG: hypothetical protein JO273_02480 [Methylobacteriaceae bacterium]|nr:hypothetical protein [Methylobacteriaceae bacterium]